MRPTIQDIFFTWKKLILTVTLLLSLITFTALQEHTSFSKIENLQEQKGVIGFIAEISRMDLEFAAIQYRGKGKMLELKYERLLTLDGYDLIGRLFAEESDDYHADLKILQEKVETFIQSAKVWYDPDESALDVKERTLINTKDSLITHINTMIEKDNAYDYSKSLIRHTLIYLTLLIMIAMAITYFKKSAMILKDIKSLYMVDMQGNAHTPVTDEITIIAKRMRKKTLSSENPDMIDPVTEINNHKGLLYAYANKKNVKDGAFVAVATFKIDEFSILDKKYSKDFTQSILKKIAFMTSLYQQPADIIGRTDYSEFTIIFSRADRNQALKDCQLIMSSVEEAKFKTPDGENLTLTLSTGFAPKHTNVTIDDTMGQSKKALGKAMAEGANRLMQT